MCSIDELEQASHNRPKKASKHREKGNSIIFPDEKTCMKCAEKAVVLVRNNDPFCRDCFLNYVVHKFRATIGKARVIHQGQRVLLAVSGGCSSSAMLDLVIKGLGKTAVKKHRFQPGVVHIDDEGLCGQSISERNSVKHHIEELARSKGFPAHFVSLEDLFHHEDTETFTKNVEDLETFNAKPSTNKNRLMELFEEVTSVTAQEDLLSHLYRNQLQKVAKDHGYDYIMVGDCGTNLAIRILADVAHGRGSQLPFNVSFKDDRSEIAVLRPMREFTKKEIEFYNHLNNVISFTIPSFTTNASCHVSINRLTEELILGLQSSFPSTVNTVLKTGNKISSNVDSSDCKHCAMCLTPLDVSSHFSVESSELMPCGGGECGSGCQNADDKGKMYKDGSGNNHDGSSVRGNGGNKGHSGALGSTGEAIIGILKSTGSSNDGNTVWSPDGSKGYGGIVSSTGSGIDGTISSVSSADRDDGTLRGTIGGFGHGTGCDIDGSLKSRADSYGDDGTLRKTGGNDGCNGILRDNGHGHTSSIMGETNNRTSDGNDSGNQRVDTSVEYSTNNGESVGLGSRNTNDDTCYPNVKANDAGNVVPDAHIGGDDSIHLLKLLCYGCKLTYHDMKDGQKLLPKLLSDNSRKQMQRTAMKEHIKDFLLDD